MNSSEVYLKKIGSALRSDPVMQPTNNEIEELMQQYLRRLRLFLPGHKRAAGKVPGAVVIVRKGDEIIHLKGYGCANLETAEEITPETVFDLGSVSKQ